MPFSPHEYDRARGSRPSDDVDRQEIKGGVRILGIARLYGSITEQARSLAPLQPVGSQGQRNNKIPLPTICSLQKSILRILLSFHPFPKNPSTCSAEAIDFLCYALSPTLSSSQSHLSVVLTSSLLPDQSFSIEPDPVQPSKMARS